MAARKNRKQGYRGKQRQDHGEPSRPCFQNALYSIDNGEALKCYRRGNGSIRFLLEKDYWLQWLSFSNEDGVRNVRESGRRALGGAYDH